jgi:hypothetical protein
MTTPVAAQQQPTIPQTQAANLAAADAALVAAIAVVLSAVSVADAFAALQIQIKLRHIRTDFEMSALRGALEAVMGHPHDRTEGVGSAQAQIARLNAVRRAQFVLHAARRITQDLREARAHGQPLGQALSSAVEREKRYYGQHLQAIIQRMDAASQTDARAAEFGPLLGWYAVRDKHTSAECLAANGKNFYVTAMPVIGFPGGVHPHCRCYPGKPHAGAAILRSARMAA